MPSLRNLQQAFLRTVFDAESGAVLPHIRPDPIPPADVLSVYRNNIIGNLTDALGETYSAVRKIVGDAFFEHTAAEYVRLTPSRSGNLNDYGAGFPDFLAQFKAAAALAYLADVARLEWACHASLLAPEPTPVDFAALGQVAPEAYAGIRFELHPSLRLLRSAYPVFRIWRLCEDGTEDPSGTVDLGEGGDRLLVVRPGLRVEVQVAQAGEFALLHAICNGEAFGDACAAALSEQDDLDIPACLQHHVAAGTVTGWRQ
ncbi:MAG: hypothetical protein B7Z66_11440 [Chromatiales bacterium 21-64-14]|nr:MAG: hypothetical protein B7Z66_11440 [Chromatiales bacterium 21-64-14]